MTRRTSVALAVLAIVIAGCAEDRVGDVARVEERRFAITPAAVPVEVGPLAGRLSELSVSQRVNVETNEVVYPPQLTGTLELKNAADDETLRLLEGRIRYLDGNGKAIPIAEGRPAATFTFYSYSQDQLDPGEQISHRIDVSFPAVALNGRLADLRLDLTYIPNPYRVESVEVPVQVSAVK